MNGANPNRSKNKYPTIKEIVLNDLREDLLSGKLEPEQVLNIKELSEKYNVSQTPIREALNNLESIGLIERISHKSIKVAKFLSDEIHEIYHMRSAISGLAAKLSARNMNMSEKRELLNLVKESANVLKKKDFDTFLKYNRKFHDSLAESIKTPIIRNIYEQFFIITKRYRKLNLEIQNADQLIKEHEAIANAVFEGDEEKAQHHGSIHYQNIIKFLEKSNIE